MTPAKAAHAIAARHELTVRQALEDAAQTLRKAGATHEDVRAFLARCAAAGAVLPTTQ